MTLKLRWIQVFLAIGLCGCQGAKPSPPDRVSVRPGDRIGIPAPSPSPEEMTAMIGLVRRSLEQPQPIRPGDVAAIVRPALADQGCRAHVTLREGGRVFAEGTGGFGPLREAFAAAVNRLRENVPAGMRRRLDVLDRAAVECELTGAAEIVPLGGGGGLLWEAYFEHGIHGIGLDARGGWREIRPSEVVGGAWGCQPKSTPAMVADLMYAGDPTGNGMLEARQVYRFRSTHFWQPRSGTDTVRLVRGLQPVTPDALDARNLDEAIHDLGDYLMSRQRPDGLFRYGYNARTGGTIETGNWVRQAGATWVLAVYAGFSGRSDARDADDRALRAWQRTFASLRAPPDATCVDPGDGKRKLGTTALILLALLDSPRAKEWTAQRDALIRGILSLQNQDGSFTTNFPPSEPTGSQYYYPGEALLALSHAYAATRDERIARVFAAAHPFYVDLFERDPVQAFVPWQTLAHVRMYALTGRREYADFALQMNDWLITKQIGSGDTPWLDSVGGIPNRPSNPPGISTASYLEGLADALALARVLGDDERSHRYEQSVRASAQFVIRLVVKPDETYFHIQPAESIGGVRTFLTDHRLRIDHVQHALAALMKTRTILFGEKVTISNLGSDAG